MYLLLISLVVYTLIIAGIWALKPKCMFKRDDSPKEWSVKMTENSSPVAPVFSFPFISIFVILLVMSLMSYFMPNKVFVPKDII